MVIFFFVSNKLNAFISVNPSWKGFLISWAGVAPHTSLSSASWRRRRRKSGFGRLEVMWPGNSHLAVISEQSLRQDMNSQRRRWVVLNSSGASHFTQTQEIEGRELHFHHYNWLYFTPYILRLFPLPIKIRFTFPFLEDAGTRTVKKRYEYFHNIVFLPSRPVTYERLWRNRDILIWGLTFRD